MTEDPCHAQDLGLQGVIVTGQGLQGGSPGLGLLTRRATAQSQGIVTGFPMTGSGRPLLSTRSLVTTTGLSRRHVTDIEIISGKVITFRTPRGGLGPLSPGTDHPTIMTKPRFTRLVLADPCLPNPRQGAEGRDPLHQGSGETGLDRSVDPGGLGLQSPLPTLQMEIMSSTERPRGTASSHHLPLLPRKLLSKRIYLMLSATFPTGTFLMILTMRRMLQE